MRKITILLILISTHSYAQKAKLNWSEKSKSENSDFSFVSGADNDFIKLSFDYDGFQKGYFLLNRFDKNLILKNEENFSDNKEINKFVDFKSVSGKLFLYTNYYDNKSKRTEYFCQQINIKSLKPEGHKISLYKFEDLKNVKQPKVSILLSADSSKILVESSEPHVLNESNKKYFTVYDNQMKRIWEYYVTIPRNYISTNTIITNDGKVCLMIKQYETEKNYVSTKDLASGIAKLLIFTKNNPNPKDFMINLDDKLINDLNFVEENGTTISLFGLYTSKKTGVRNGYFICKIDHDYLKIENIETYAFPTDLNPHLLKNHGQTKLAEPSLESSFKFVKSIKRKNGSVDYILENQIGGYSGGQIQTYGCKYGDILDICIDNLGKTVISRIPKLQYCLIENYLSFQVLTYQNKLILFYNDEKNLNQDITKFPNDFTISKNTDFAMAVVDSNGNVSRNVLIGHNEAKSVVAVNNCYKITENKLALYANTFNLYSATKEMVGTLELE